MTHILCHSLTPLLIVFLLMSEIRYEVAILLLKLVERCFRSLIFFKIVKAHA